MKRTDRIIDGIECSIFENGSNPTEVCIFCGMDAVSPDGRDEDKVKAAGLTPVAIGDSVTYEEANLTFLCKKLY